MANITYRFIRKRVNMKKRNQRNRPGESKIKKNPNSVESNNGTIE